MVRLLTVSLLWMMSVGFIAGAASAQVTSYTLDNGMDIVVIEDHRAPVVTHMVWYRAGAADEKPGQSGIAHFLEHLMFKATDELESGEFSRIVAANGGNDNAFTSHDYTAYFQRIISDRLELVMQLESDRMTDLVLSDADIIPERNVVLEERNQRVENNPGSLFAEQRNAALYLNHPYGRPVIGWKHEVETLDREDALEWYRTYYAPNNAILIVAGDVEPEEVKRLAEKYYGPLAPSENLPERVRAQEPPHLSARRLVYNDPRVRQPYVIRSYLAPERNAGDQETAAALTILAEMLGGSGITSVMGRKLQIEEELAVATGSFYSGEGLDTQSFGIYVVPRDGVSLEEAEAGMDAAIAAFIEEGPDPEHLERIKTQIRAAEIFSLDNQEQLARRYGAALTQGLTIEDVAVWPEVLGNVEAEDLIEAAKAVFEKDNSVTGWLRGRAPKPEPASQTSEGKSQ